MKPFIRIRKLIHTLRSSLKVNMALGVALPVLMILAVLSFLHYSRERVMMIEQLEESGRQLSQVTLGSLQYAMLVNDRVMITESLAGVSEMPNILQVQILDLNGRVVSHSNPDEVSRIHFLDDQGCAECHRGAQAKLANVINLEAQSDVMRIVSPIQNERACTKCHDRTSPVLGRLILDLSSAEIQAHVLADLRLHLLFTALSAIFVTGGVYALLHLRIVRRVDLFNAALTSVAGGDFSVRLPAARAVSDEIDQFATGFNKMASDLEIMQNAEALRSEVRERAIQEERTRIARELHDGLGQLLGYVNTKTMAIRLLVQKRQLRTAETQLLQLEEAARALFMDTREAILGLKANTNEQGFIAALGDYVEQFSQLTSLPVNLRIDPQAEVVKLPPDDELQLLRIVQEALANVRKHAEATNACVCFLQQNGSVVMTIDDDGKGFDLDVVKNRGTPSYGLETMRERAAEAGAEFEIQSVMGEGTTILVRVPLKEAV